jgi:hypothetical protein
LKPVAYTSLEFYVKLPEKFSFKDAQEVTRLSETMLKYYIYGDWQNGNLIKREKIGRRVFYKKLCNETDPKKIAKKLLTNKEIRLIGYKIPEGLQVA